MKCVGAVGKFTSKSSKKGYLLLEVAVMMAIIGILSIPIYGALTTATHTRSKALAYNKKSVGLKGLEKIIKKDCSFNDLSSLGEIDDISIEKIIPKTNAIYEILDLEHVSISINAKDEELNIIIRNNFIDESLNIRKVKWLDIE